MSTDQGWEKWYWRDWFSDPDVQCLSACGRCGWFELLGWMWLNETDRWEGQKSTLKRLLKMDNQEFEAFLVDIIESDAADVTHNGANERITLVSRRRERDNEKNERTRENNRIRQERFRRKKQEIRDVTQSSLNYNGTESESESDKRGGARKRGTRLTEDWSLPEDWEVWATEEGHPDPNAAAQRFRDHWLSKSGANATKRDWLATWRNWIRTDIERGYTPRKPLNGPAYG